MNPCYILQTHPIINTVVINYKNDTVIAYLLIYGLENAVQKVPNPGNTTLNISKRIASFLYSNSIINKLLI